MQRHVCGLLPLDSQFAASSSMRRYMARPSNLPELAVTVNGVDGQHKCPPK